MTEVLVSLTFVLLGVFLPAALILRMAWKRVLKDESEIYDD